MISDKLIETFKTRYQLESMLGRGGMAAVYRATRISDDQIVALKIPLSNTPEQQAQLLKEYQFLELLKSSHVPSVYEYGELGGKHFIAMEFIPGVSLSQIINSNLPAYLTRLIWLRDIAEALNFVHSKGVIFNDVSSGNILVSSDSDLTTNVKLIDCGISLRENEERAHCERENFLEYFKARHLGGTLEYKSPEAYYQEPLYFQSDIYSFGLLAYELLTSKRAFNTDAEHEMFRQHDLRMMHLAARIPTIRSQNREASRTIETMIMVCMQKKIEDRYDTFDPVIESLNREIESENKRKNRKSFREGVKGEGTGGNALFSNLYARVRSFLS